MYLSFEEKCVGTLLPCIFLFTLKVGGNEMTDIYGLRAREGRFTAI